MLWQLTNRSCWAYIYRMAGNFGGKIFWRIAKNMSFGGIYFGGWVSLSYNDIPSKMANRTRLEFKRAVSLFPPLGRNRWLNATEIVVMLTLDCFRPVGLYSDRVRVLWIAFLALTDKPPLSFCVQNSLEKRCPRTQLSNGKLHADD